MPAPELLAMPAFHTELTGPFVPPSPIPSAFRTAKLPSCSSCTRLRIAEQRMYSRKCCLKLRARTSVTGPSCSSGFRQVDRAPEALTWSRQRSALFLLTLASPTNRWRAGTRIALAVASVRRSLPIIGERQNQARLCQLIAAGAAPCRPWPPRHGSSLHCRREQGRDSGSPPRTPLPCRSAWNGGPPCATASPPCNHPRRLKALHGLTLS